MHVPIKIQSCINLQLFRETVLGFLGFFCFMFKFLVQLSMITKTYKRSFSLCWTLTHVIVTWLFFSGQGNIINMSRAIAVSVLGVFVLLEACHAHLCLISPTQRGSLAGINKQGMIHLCFFFKKKCDYETVDSVITCSCCILLDSSIL